MEFQGNATTLEPTFGTNVTDGDFSNGMAVSEWPTPGDHLVICGNESTTLPPECNVTTAPPLDPLGGHQVWEVVLICLLTCSLSIITVGGNILVFVSFRVNRQLHTVNNYFLLSLAVADTLIGLLSMNLYTVYMVMGRWALGPAICDLYLTVDYVSSNASVMNLCVISFDRYFSITRPLTYRAKRTPRRAACLIALAWVTSVLVWAPLIVGWQYIVGGRNVPEGQCYIQFIEDSVYVNYLTIAVAFYIPVIIMCTLYYRIYRETQERQKNLSVLQASSKFTTSRSNTSLTSSAKLSEGHRHQAKAHDAVDPSGKGDERPSISRKASYKDDESSLESPDSIPTKADPKTKHIVTEKPTKHASRLKKYNIITKISKDGSMGKKAKMPATEIIDDPNTRAPSPGDTRRRRGAPLTRMNAHYSKGRRGRRNGSFANLLRTSKALRMLSAILLAFVITWLPYSVTVLFKPFCEVPQIVWDVGYWLCYVNSTINPWCYAFCNKTFRKTLKDVLVCKY
ncbi:muscarinic acetylcholine receptor M1-like [Branchiostoma floridae]|uniref:Muscarinic acetylcholine receptor M1-like n=1 Tax=Branchiostoma floridae TaxID=7739 RepID=A0A9J7L9B0_BRAFL|nr:muscarinic acetylcholine receptor M1-like [Branchiostoma floridae]